MSFCGERINSISGPLQLQCVGDILENLQSAHRGVVWCAVGDAGWPKMLGCLLLCSAAAAVTAP